jgi:hypothetical protein
VQGFLLSRPLSAQDLENRYLLTAGADLTYAVRNREIEHGR